MGKIIRETQDLTYLSWSKIRHSSGTAGSFLKAQSELDGKKLYYKLSNYDVVNGITGHESVNEIIADRLLGIFDHGLSLLFSARDDAAVENYDISDHKPVQSFVGANSTKENLMLIPAEKLPDISAFKESDRAVLFDGLGGIISNKLMEKIWTMIWERRCHYESLCDQRR